MRIKFYLSENPTITSQEKGYNRYTGQFYTKEEVVRLKREYGLGIRNSMMVNKLTTPCYEGAVRLKVVFTFSSSLKKNWGLLKSSKPDADNACKALLDTIADLGFFKTGDQQVCDLQVIKLWGSHPSIEIDIEEVPYDIYRL